MDTSLSRPKQGGAHRLAQARGRRLTVRRVRYPPVFCDLFRGGDPNVAFAQDVVQEALERHYPAGSATKLRMINEEKITAKLVEAVEFGLPYLDYLLRRAQLACPRCKRMEVEA